MEYKSFKEFYWKRAVWTIGLPWGLLTGILFAITRKKEVLEYFTNWITLLQILFFILGGFLLAFTYGKSLWKRGKAIEAEKEKKGQ
jgi:hypothetical protein